MLLTEIIRGAIDPALQLLPKKFDSREARTLMLAIGLQESRFEYRRQLGNGPARGFWQFEEGTRASRGGVWGVYLHSASADLLRQLGHDRDVSFDPHAIWAALEQDDVLAAGVARLMLFTNPKPLPAIGDADGAWAYYLNTWRPGKPHPETWPALYVQALATTAPPQGA
jgi:hypothetical protein